jgi:hypothetical protein
MEWFVARVGDPVAVRALRELVAEEVRAARVAGGLGVGAQIYARIDAATVAFVFNDAARRACPTLQRLDAPSTPSPSSADQVNLMIGSI